MIGLSPLHIIIHTTHYCYYTSSGNEYLMDVEEIRLGNALFNTKLLKSMFFVGEPIQICMRGKFRRDVPRGISKLQASVHGDVQVVGDLVKVKYPFCDIDREGCPGLTDPGCGSAEVKKDDEFCFCSVLTEVPTSPDVRKLFGLSHNLLWLKILSQTHSNLCFFYMVSVKLYIVEFILHVCM